MINSHVYRLLTHAILFHYFITNGNSLPTLDGQSVIVETKLGKLRGRIDLDYWHQPFYSFEGIPYAKPPIGELRFKAPREPEPWTDGIRDATIPADCCVQIPAKGSEDCLVLNIHSKLTNETNGELKPVMVWIHGGAFQVGSASSYLFGPEFLVRENIVLVKVQYRLSIFGFLRLEDDSLEVSGNAGLKDQVMALKWIQSNIESFGGDPNRVTIFGESAGGASTHLLMLSSMATGLFHRVISMSGCGLNPWVGGSVVPSEKYLESVECPKDGGKQTLECLQKAPKEVLITQASRSYKRGEGFGVVIENSATEKTFISENIETIMQEGKFSHLPYMAGYVPDEGVFLYLLGLGMKVGGNPLNLNYIPKSLREKLTTEQGKRLNDEIKDFYFGNRTDSQAVLEQYMEYMTDNLILQKLYTTAKIQATISTAPVFFYKFNYDTRLNLRSKMFPQNFVTHTDDNQYLFTNFKTPKNMTDDSPEMMAVKQVTKIWATFASTGDPNPIYSGGGEKLKIEWKPITKEHFNYLVLSLNVELLEDPETERMKFWDDFYLNL